MPALRLLTKTAKTLSGFLAALFLLFILLPSDVSAATNFAKSKYVKGLSTDTAETIQSAYVIGSENVIQIKIFGEAGINQIYRVDERGFINHALVGRVKLGGYTVAEAERVMESTLRGDYILNPQVNLFVLEHSRFSVMGEVRKPGTYELLGRVSVIEAISMSGGFTPVANQRDVKILRKEDDRERTIKVDTTNLTHRGEWDEDAYVRADDVIVIGKSFF